MPTNFPNDPQVSCPDCILAETDREWLRPGNAARADMGHAMYFSNTGRIAACLARKQERDADLRDPQGYRFDPN